MKCTPNEYCENLNKVIEIMGFKGNFLSRERPTNFKTGKPVDSPMLTLNFSKRNVGYAVLKFCPFCGEVVSGKEAG